MEDAATTGANLVDDQIFCLQLTSARTSSKGSPDDLPFSHRLLREVLQKTAECVSTARRSASSLT